MFLVGNHLRFIFENELTHDGNFRIPKKIFSFNGLRIRNSIANSGWISAWISITKMVRADSACILRVVFCRD